MYCIKCGVKLADTEKACPLCGTVPYHPDLVATETVSLYPANRRPLNKISMLGIKVLVSVAFVIAFAICFLCDVQIKGQVTWSAYVMGALVTAYICFVTPFWFKKPSPIVFVPLSFLTVGIYVLFINLFTNGNWFLSFAFPVIGIVGLLVTTVVVLTTFIKRGRLYVYGSALVAFGCFMPLLELFLSITFNLKFIWWCLYPLTALVIVGLTVLFFAFCPTARERVERKFFL